MKKILPALAALLCLLALTGCGCDHVWSEPTCTDAPVCTLCGEAQEGGEALGHNFAEATCLTPKTCTDCGAAQGEPGGHSWKSAGCLAPKTCRNCGAIEGEALGHNWQEATCTAPRTCSRCKLKDGEALGHRWEGSCDVRRTCALCQKKETRAQGHSYAEGVCANCGRKEVETLEDFVKYLNKTYPALQTAVAKVEDITYEYKDLSGDMFADHDFELQIMSTLYSKEKKYSLDYIINYGTMLPYTDRVRAAVEVFDFQMTLAKEVERFFPGKKAAIYFYQWGYEYPSIQVGYNSTTYLPFLNYKQNKNGTTGYTSTDLCGWYMDEGKFMADGWLHHGTFSDSADQLYDDIIAACDYDLTFRWHSAYVEKLKQQLPFLP